MTTAIIELATLMETNSDPAAIPENLAGEEPDETDLDVPKLSPAEVDATEGSVTVAVVVGRDGWPARRDDRTLGSAGLRRRMLGVCQREKVTVEYL